MVYDQIPLRFPSNSLTALSDALGDALSDALSDATCVERRSTPTLGGVRTRHRTFWRGRRHSDTTPARSSLVEV